MAEPTRSSLEDGGLSVSMLPESEGPASPRRRPNLLRGLRRRKLLGVLRLLLAAAAAVPGLFLLSRPVFQAESLLVVSPVFAKNLSEDREFQLPRYNEFLKQQLLTAVREDVTLDALERLGEKRPLWMRPGESRRDAAARLSRALAAIQVPETGYISVALQGAAPEGLAEVVNAVVESYLARVKGQPLYGFDTRIEALNRHKAKLSDEIRAKSDLLARWAKEQGVPGFDSKTYETAFQEAQRSLQAARARRVEADARLVALDARHEILRKIDLGVEAREHLGADTELAGLKSVLLAKKSDLRGKLTGLTPEHEGRQVSEKMIAEIDAEIEKAEKAALVRVREVLEQRREARLKDERQNALAEVEQAKRFEELLSGESQAHNQKMSRFSDVYYAAMGVQSEVERLRRQLATVEDRVDLMQLESFAPGFIHLVAPAAAPAGPMPPRLGKWIALFVLAAVGLAVGVPALVDSLDSTVRCPADVARVLHGFELLGIPERGSRTEHLVHDQVRRLALAIDRERRTHRKRRFVFTSAKPGGGTTELVLELANELGAVGAHAAAVEANALKPDPRFGNDNGRPGLDAVLRGRAPLFNALLPAQNGLPARLPTGDTAGRRRLIGPGNLRAVFEEMATRFDLLLIDAPPVLISSDAELLAELADAVVLVVGAGRTSLGEVQRAHRILRQVGCPVLQVVVNRVRVERGGAGELSVAGQTSAG